MHLLLWINRSMCFKSFYFIYTEMWYIFYVSMTFTNYCIVKVSFFPTSVRFGHFLNNTKSSYCYFIALLFRWLKFIPKSFDLITYTNTFISKINYDVRTSKIVTPYLNLLSKFITDMHILMSLFLFCNMYKDSSGYIILQNLIL